MDEPQADLTHRQDHANANVWPNAMDYDNSHVHLASTAAESYQLSAPHDLNKIVGPAAMSTARGASAALHAAAGLQPSLQSAFQPMMYQNAVGQDPLVNNHHETIEQFLLREFASGQRVDLLTEAVQLQYGHRMTPDDLFMTYRIAFWKTRSWEESDTSLMEQIVREEIRGLWNRGAGVVSLPPSVLLWKSVAKLSQMRERSGREWPPHEVKMRYMRLHPSNAVPYA
ncbi:hypothetical protein LTS01_023814 [Friedmanniomyces endolithicus]|nr:hypothetical protein LTS01_023814 [Friedmanniomyces endolithicus]